MPIDDPKQLTISFDHDVLLSKELEQGLFTTYLTIPLTQPATSQADPWALPCGFMQHVQKYLPQNILSFMVCLPDDLAISSLEQLKHGITTPFLLPLSGACASLEQIRQSAAEARSIGIRNFLLTTGDLPKHLQLAAEETHPTSLMPYTDSVDALAAMSYPPREQTLAATVNPYKYTPETLCWQFAKAIRKHNSGASFLIAQAGWDIAKAQEYQWYLQMREILIPTIARILVLPPQKAVDISHGIEPGITMPVPIAAKLIRLTDSQREFYDYQLQLDALLAIGYKKLGFSGILLDMPLDDALFDTFMAMYSALDSQVRSYDDWRERWFAFNGDASLAPAPTLHTSEPSFYFFANLLEAEHNCYSPETSRQTRSDISKPSTWLSLKAKFLDPQNMGFLAKATRKLLKTEQQPTSYYGLDTVSCPKHLINTPCGNSRTDGFCEAGHAPCAFNKIFQIAAQRNELDRLESNDAHPEKAKA